jgi:hypothetical protein
MSHTIHLHGKTLQFDSTTIIVNAPVGRHTAPSMARIVARKDLRGKYVHRHKQQIRRTHVIKTTPSSDWGPASEKQLLTPGRHYDTLVRPETFGAALVSGPNAFSRILANDTAAIGLIPTTNPGKPFFE